MLPTNIIAHQREHFGGLLEPSISLTTTYKKARNRGKIAPIWSVGELVKTAFLHARQESDCWLTSGADGQG